MNYTKKIAYEVANQTRASIYEIKSTENTKGTSGFWWCGRYGLRHLSMPIEEITIDLTSYDHVTICSPIWVLQLSSPIRTFCQKARGKIKKADYILVHCTNHKYGNAVKEMDELLDIKHENFTSISCKIGKVKVVSK